MKILVVCNEIPYPPNHGGRVDVWNRLRAFRAAGASIFLVTWCSDRENERPSRSDLAAIRETVADLRVFPIRRTPGERLKRLLRLLRWPSHVSSRYLSDRQLEQAREGLQQFKPEVVWLDGLYGLLVGQKMAREFSIPIFYRSHNIEHRYMAGQVTKARSWRDRLAWSLNLPHLKKVEHNVIRMSAAFFDISSNDLEFWREQGYGDGHWLPPLVDPAVADRLAAAWKVPPAFDIGYLGNLYSPNNVEGLLWFLEGVLPRIRETRPGIKVLIAGNRPLKAVIAASNRIPEVTLVESPADAVGILRQARVLINPIFVGSGVNVKSVEMLFSPAAVVSTPPGLAGLPSHVRACFSEATGEEEFADAVLDALDEDSPVDQIREEARVEFSFKRIDEVLANLREICARSAQ